MTFEVSQSVIDKAKAHAIREFPKESCGFVRNDDYFEIENISQDPENTFEISPEVSLEFIDALAFIHSHPVADAFNHLKYKQGFYPFCPSESDMRSQIATGMNWGIIVTDGENAVDPFFWGDFILNLPTLGAKFRHGVEDCYTIAQKHFWQVHGIKLDNFPRGDDWWTTNQDMYVNNFSSQNFVRLDSTDKLQESDCGLIQIGGKRVVCLNHAMIYMGDGTVIHHLPNRLSTRDAMGGRIDDIKIWLRHKDLFK